MRRTRQTALKGTAGRAPTKVLGTGGVKIHRKFIRVTFPDGSVLEDIVDPEVKAGIQASLYLLPKELSSKIKLEEYDEANQWRVIDRDSFEEDNAFLGRGLDFPEDYKDFASFINENISSERTFGGEYLIAMRYSPEEVVYVQFNKMEFLQGVSFVIKRVLNEEPSKYIKVYDNKGTLLNIDY